MSSRTKTAAPVTPPLVVTPRQADALFHAIAMVALTARGIAAEAGAAVGNDLRTAEAFYGLQHLFEHIGALADAGAGDDVVGSLLDWACGRDLKDDER